MFVLLWWQAEPECEWLKQDVEDVRAKLVVPKDQWDKVLRSKTEFLKHSVKNAEGAISEVLEMQAALRTHEAKLQILYEKRQRVEAQMKCREQETKALEGARLLL